jgi:uncharacterized membrane protein HdeD (DUF308 family)
MTTALEMENKFTRAVLFLGGIVALVFGLLLLTRTEGTIEVIMLLLGLWWLIMGLFNILAIFIDKSQWGWKLFGGILGVIAGLLVLNFPLAGGAIIIVFKVFILGILGMLFGIASLVAAFRGAGWGAGIFGAVSLIIGLLLMFNVVIGAKILILILAIFLILDGIVALVLGFMSKN